ncbi:transcriptional regulator family: Fungal Specific TF [Aspergillus niger]|nr:transcriptional regulator family: Fungal Specific TF [Aspergillus niger]
MMHQQFSLECSQPHPVYSSNAAMSDAATGVARGKRHAACDECRSRKLKCSGEATGCTRCIKQSLTCHYSLQKQMGRPPKKRMREDEDPSPPFGLPGNEPWTSESDFASLGPSTIESTETAPSDYSGQINFFTDANSNIDAGQFLLNKPIDAAPTTVSPWPDFSNVSSSAANLYTLPPDLSLLQQSSAASSPTSEESDRQCPCLSCLYLCLSHLSSLAPFPLSHHNLCSLYIASRTARAVIRCQICPLRFTTGMQNVTFTGTLLTVIADTWLRISKVNAVDFGRQSAPPAYAAAIDASPNPAKGWEDWLRQTVRYRVIGGPCDPAGMPPGADDGPSLLSLIEEMEERQRRWHRSHPLPVEERHLPIPKTDGSKEEESCHERDALCMRIIQSARNVIPKFGFQPSDYPDDAVAKKTA